jgi:hypothetical protein
MALRLGCLLTVAVIACVSAVGSAATCVANVQQRWAALAG